MSKYEVGQQVWRYDSSGRNRPPTQVEVTKVARLLVTVGEGWNAEQFRIETGQLNSKDFPHHAKILTEEEKVAAERRSAAQKALRDSGLQFDLGREHRVSTETLERLVEVLRDSDTI